MHHGLRCEDRAQATVEAALLLPSFLVLLLVALQPVCLLYTRAVMESAASSTARLMVTASRDDDDSYRAFALRQLAAVPNVSIFHVGGPLSWEIELERGASPCVTVTGHARPLPVLGIFASAFGKTDARGNVRLKVKVAYEGRPEWLEGSYDSWISAWD